jgi:hypothetical protein
MKVVLVFITFLLFSCKQKIYRIEQYYYLNGKNIEGLMWNDLQKVNSNTYSYKIPTNFNPNYREVHDQFDSVVFKIVEIK